MMDFKAVIAALRAGWWIAVVGALLGGALAFIGSVLQAPLYSSTTQFFVSTRDSASSAEVFQGGQFSQERVMSYAQLLTGEELAERVVNRMDLDMSPEALSQRVSASAVTDTVLLDVTVLDESPEQARAIAESIGQVFPAFVAELERPDESAASPVRVTVTEQPNSSDEPTTPRTTRDVGLGLLLGLLIGAGAAVLRAQLDRSVKSAQMASDCVDGPVLGTIMKDVGLQQGHLIDRAFGARAVEDYRQLRNNLQFLRVDEPPKVIMVSSAVPSEGKTTAVVNLGLTLAEAGKRVTVVEADLRRPKVTRYLRLVGGVGLTNVLSGSAELQDVLQQHGNRELYVLAAGPTPPNPGELLSSSAMCDLVDGLREKNDYVLIDAPPLLPVADATGLAVLVDGVVLSVRYGKTRREELRAAAKTLEGVGASLLGVLLNIVPANSAHAAARGYGYEYQTEPQQRPGVEHGAGGGSQGSNTEPAEPAGARDRDYHRPARKHAGGPARD